MISREILKRAATAGALGAAVLGGTVWMASNSEEAESPGGEAAPDQSAETAPVPAEALARPEVRQAPPPGGRDRPESETTADSAVERSAESRARREARRRAVERLARAERLEMRDEAPGASATIRQQEARIDRALRDAVEETYPAD